MTAYNSNNAASGACEDDRFVVLVYADETWTILREWNNSGSTYVYNNIATTGENVSISLANYNGKTVKIAFYGESTVSGGDNDLHIDNVGVGTHYAAGEWQSTSSTTSPKQLTGLTENTSYEVQVQGVCGETTTEWTTLNFKTAKPWPGGGSDDPVFDNNVIIEDGVVAEANSITLINGAQLIIEDGGQLIVPNNATVQATVKKSVAHGASKDADNWYVISSPVNNIASADVTNLIQATPANYDYYYYDEATSQDGTLSATHTHTIYIKVLVQPY